MESIIKGIAAIWESYSNELTNVGIAEDIISKIEAETVGYTVAEVCRTALEFAGGRKWLQFEDPEVKSNSRKAALQIVETCMVNRHENGIKLLVESIEKECAK